MGCLSDTWTDGLVGPEVAPNTALSTLPGPPDRCPCFSPGPCQPDARGVLLSQEGEGRRPRTGQAQGALVCAAPWLTDIPSLAVEAKTQKCVFNNTPGPVAGGAHRPLTGQSPYRELRGPWHLPQEQVQSWCPTWTHPPNWLPQTFCLGKTHPGVTHTLRRPVWPRLTPSLQLCTACCQGGFLWDPACRGGGDFPISCFSERCPWPPSGQDPAAHGADAKSGGRLGAEGEPSCWVWAAATGEPPTHVLVHHTQKAPREV